jgi:hypothetical protein
MCRVPETKADYRFRMRRRKRRDAGEERQAPEDSERPVNPAFRVLQSEDELRDALKRATSSERSTLSELVERAHRHSRRAAEAPRRDASEPG